ncbi:hypothetical protein [Microbulbifer sediminum]|uniref:hypothetical protein n=1 Tax=Microbulbifer sediminum TaxID=2904250 RepID=UPI001F3988F5|nr:hypothetical protein [Microbulbifer sediminum]
MDFYRISLFSLILVLGACSGGGGSSSDNGNEDVADTEAPTAQIEFPPKPGLWSDQEILIIRGTSADNAGIAKVVVNGVEAETTDGFLNWTAPVSLKAGGATNIEVVVTDTSGNVTSNAAETTVNAYDRFDSYRFCGPVAYDSTANTAYTFSPPSALDLETGIEQALPVELDDVDGATFDPASGRFLLIQNDILYSYDSGFHGPTVVSPAQSPSFGSNPQISIDEATGTIYVLEWWASYVVAVDPATGARTHIGGWKYADGTPPLDANPGFRVVGGRFFFVTVDALLELDPSTSTVKELSGPNVGSGPELIRAAGLAVDLVQGRAYVGDEYNRLLEINLATGDREVASTRLGGGELNRVFDWLRYGFADTGSSVLVNSCSTGHSFLIDKATGQRKQLGRIIRGQGPSPTYLKELAYNSVTGNLIAINDIYDEYSQLIAIHRDTGDRKFLSGSAAEPAPASDFLESVEVNPVDGAVFAVRWSYTQPSAILALSPGQAVWEELTDGKAGSGPELGSFTAIAFDSRRNTLLATGFVVDQGGCLLRVDPTSGDREILTCSASYGTEGYWGHVSDLVVDSANDRAYLANAEGGILAIDLETGGKQLLSGDGVGAGPDFIELGQMALDSATGFLLVENYIGKNPDTGKSDVVLVEVDLMTGDRTDLLKLTQLENEHVTFLPAIDRDTGTIYLALPNRSIAVLDRETRQYLILSQ